MPAQLAGPPLLLVTGIHIRSRVLACSCPSILRSQFRPAWSLYISSKSTFSKRLLNPSSSHLVVLTPEIHQISPSQPPSEERKRLQTRMGGANIRMVSATANNTSAPTIRTAACLVIGDEILNGKTIDTNSALMAQWCFSLGITLKRIEVIADDEEEIIEAVRRMSDRYDFVITSGGIGPTHDDITYQSIAKAFSLSLVLHQPAFERMKALSKPHPSRPHFTWDKDSPELRAKRRMVELPIDESRNPGEQVLFVDDSLWVPVAIVNRNIYILPGVPRIFEALLKGLKSHIAPRLADVSGRGICRVLISTPLPESTVAEYLGKLAAQVEPQGIKVGSYPRWKGKRNTVSLVGRDQALIERLVPDVIAHVKGRRIHMEGEDDSGPEI